MEKLSQAVVFGLMMLYPLAMSRAETPYPTAWIRQFGTSSADRAFALSTDGIGNFYVAGRTGGNLEGASAGADDAFLSKFDASGNRLWTRQFGNTFGDEADGIAADALGNVFVSGTTERTNQGNSDAFLNMYDSGGTAGWTRQYAISTNDHRTTRVVTDGIGNVFVAGSSSHPDPFHISGSYFNGYLRQYSTSGTPGWTQSISVTSTTDTFLGGVAIAGGGSLYVAGDTYGTLDPTNPNPDLAASDAFIRKYDALGNAQWTRQRAKSGWDGANAVATDSSGNVYITGHQGRQTSSISEQDLFLTKYDSAGNLQWIRDFGTPAADDSNAIAVDGSGNIFIAGYASGSLGDTYAAGADAFARKYDPNGNLLWTRQLGTTGDDEVTGLTLDTNGNVYIAGYTNSALGGQQNNGSYDAWIAKLSAPIPGDFNGDGAVDAADYVTWRKGLGTKYSPSDYDVWRSHFGQTAGSGTGSSANAAVPEPATLALLIFTSPCWYLRRDRTV